MFYLESLSPTNDAFAQSKLQAKVFIETGDPSFKVLKRFRRIL